MCAEAGKLVWPAPDTKSRPPQRSAKHIWDGLPFFSNIRELESINIRRYSHQPTAHIWTCPRWWDNQQCQCDDLDVHKVLSNRCPRAEEEGLCWLLAGKNPYSWILREQTKKNNCYITCTCVERLKSCLDFLWDSWVPRADSPVMRL